MANPSTHSIVEIADIRDNVVLLKNGSLRMVLEVSAINFELRSEEEQNAILQGFQNFLNSVDFPIQIILSSQRYNIDEYLKTVEAATATLSNDLLKIQGEEYAKFIKEISTLANVMSKHFYIVIPFYVIESTSGKGVLDSIKSIFKSSTSISAIDPAQFTTYQNQLLQRADLISGSLMGSGLRARVLEKDELTNLLYVLYNPGNKPKA